jgi:hypothetical protein
VARGCDALRLCKHGADDYIGTVTGVADGDTF